MAQVEELKTVHYHLQLTEEEAVKLKALMQNPIPGYEHNFELNELRETLWNALNNAGVS